MLRLLVSVPLAMLLSLFLFYNLALITSMGDYPAQDTALEPVFDFLLVRQEDQIEVRRRKLPEPPEVVEEPEPDIPKPDLSNMFKVSAPPVRIDVPNISMQMDFQLSPSLHNLQMPAAELSVESNPTVLSRVPPRYPQRALRRSQEGKVVVEFIITAQGTVKQGSLVVIQSTPPGVFDRAVKRAIKRWRFQKRMLNGQAVAFKARQELEFKLEK